MSEAAAMRSGAPYDALDRELLNQRRRAKQLCQRYNQCDFSQRDLRAQLLKKLLPNAQSPQIESDFYCDYGGYIYMGRGVFINHHCVMLDGADIHIGSDCMIGPQVVITTVTHTALPSRKSQCAKVVLHEGVWVGAKACILPGVEIGEGAVVAAGAMVNQSVAAGVTVGGVPARPL